MSFFKTSTYNNTWVITRVSREKFITTKQWIDDIDDDEYWNIFSNISGVYILIGDQVDKNSKKAKQVHYVGQTSDFKQRWNVGGHRKLPWVKEIVFIRGLTHITKDDLLFIEKLLVEIMLENKLNITTKITSKDSKSFKSKNVLKREINEVIIPGMKMIGVPGVDLIVNKSRKKKVVRKSTNTTASLVPTSLSKDKIDVSWRHNGKTYHASLHPEEQKVSLLKGQKMNVLLNEKSYPGAVRQVLSNTKSLRNRKYITITYSDKDRISYQVNKDTPLMAPTLAIKMISGMPKSGWKHWKDDKNNRISIYKNV